MLALQILPLLSVVALASPLLRRQAGSETRTRTVDALWDGQCFYPESDDGFDLEDYLGRWYQVAGTVAPFTAGCTCIFAEYSLNDNGTVNVFNGCQAGEQNIEIQGNAAAADETYGDEGVFRVQFPGQPPPECPGPNYIVQGM
ncbi:outer membrane lipoprotein Blc [Exophiala aquamarina CBS 119918]|uniref:Outer membrane lipoprotein Blc n=1 Tax=Exophiala aquamarina CBS 119918 TaxID=1182545 RepID=A0A072PME6_9EURO|nr:outer membrane lipoprotein Blc [Exophiala aquamarina CBS 119918]KEF61051.1 outer membrane lipoprotein Blc [Exophiala aquamarina CBS 119918]